MKKLDRNTIANAMTYEAYRALIDNLMAQKKTTGENHSEAMLNYTNLNIARMNRLDRTTKLTSETIEQLQQIEQPQIWLTITEGWCGDAAQIVPVLQKMAEQNNKIELRLILRDENLDIMDAFLTNGGRSIPKVIMLNAETLEVLDTWGPRPAEVQAMVMDTKEKMAKIADKEVRKATYQEAQKATQRWYAKDKTNSTQKELVEVLAGVEAPIS